MSDRPAPRTWRPLLRPRQAVRIAVGLWLVLGVVLWNVVFDHVIVSAGRDYLHRQALAQQHKGPKVTIAEVMEPAAVQGALVASFWSLLVTAVGLAAVGYAASRLDNEDDVKGRRSSARGPSTLPS